MVHSKVAWGTVGASIGTVIDSIFSSFGHPLPPNVAGGLPIILTFIGGWLATGSPPTGS